MSGLLLCLGFFCPDEAGAQIYKYKKPDGSVVYTDSLAQLPAERRAFYNRREEEREKKKKELERALGKEEYERQEAERAKKEIEAAKLREEERQARLAAIDEQLLRFRKRKEQREASRAQWKKRLEEATKKRDVLLAEFKEVQAKHDAIAIQPSFTLLPGQNEEREKASKRLAELEPEIDRAIEEVDVVIPDEARKAGVPPGWLR